MSQDNNTLEYYMNISFYKGYLSSMSCEDDKTKEILLQHYPLNAKETYLKVMQEEENEILAGTEKTLINDFSNYSPLVKSTNFFEQRAI
jgi:hypothetical protein